MKQFGKQDLVYLANGATFLGSGGGGTLSAMLGMIKTLPDDTQIDVVTVEEAAADDEVMTTVCAFVGSQAGAEGDDDPTGATNAVTYFDKEIVQKQYGKPLGRLVPVEMGVQSSVIPACFIAMMKGWSVVDADGAGRAVPALAATSMAANLPLSPVALADFHSLRMTIEAEDCGTSTNPPIVPVNQATNGVAAGLTSGVAGIALWPMDAATIRQALPFAGSLQLARDIGKILVDTQNAAPPRPDPLPEILALAKPVYSWAEVIFEGIIEHVIGNGNYTVVTLKAGSNSVAIHTVAESTIAFDGSTGAPIAMAPDSICYATRDGETFSNTEVAGHRGEVVKLVGIAAHGLLRTNPVIQAAFKWVRGAAGYYGPYRTIESLNDGTQLTGWRRVSTSQPEQPQPTTPSRRTGRSIKWPRRGSI